MPTVITGIIVSTKIDIASSTVVEGRRLRSISTKQSLFSMASQLEVLVCRRTDTATIPLKGSTGAAGFDLYADHDLHLFGLKWPVAVILMPMMIVSLINFISNYIFLTIFIVTLLFIISIRFIEMMKSKTVVSTGISCAIPKGYYGQIFGRSGLAVKGITVGGGVIDSDYRGDIGVILHNNSFHDFNVTRGMRIAQLVILPCPDVVLMPAASMANLGASERGSGGFGSTGR